MIKVYYCDNHVIVAYKEKGILSQPDGSNKLDMLTILKDYIKEKYNKPGNVFLGLVHRLDINTSGVMVFARTSKGAERLSEAVSKHLLRKKYITKEDLEYFFGNEENDKNDLDFYEKMHNDITLFLHDNFNNPEDAFKYFHNEIHNNNYINDTNNYITRKEFFNSISNLFPEKYSTNAINLYYSKYFQDKPQITYSEFTHIYYNTYNFDSQYSK